VFEVYTCLKEENSLSPTLFNIILVKDIREMQRETTGVVIGQHHIQVLEFSDYLIGLSFHRRYE